MTSRIVTLLIVITLATNGCQERVAEWSPAVDGLQGRLILVKGEPFEGTPRIIPYLELRNCNRGIGVLDMKFNRKMLRYEVHDEQGRYIPIDGPPMMFNAWEQDPGLIRIPYDSTLRMNVRQDGTSMQPNQAGQLEVLPMTAWTFRHGDTHSYTVSATFTVPSQRGLENGNWSGTLVLPPTPLPRLDK